MDEVEFTRLAVNRGIISMDEARQCFKRKQEMKRGGIDLAIWQILLMNGFITQEQVKAILAPDEILRQDQFGPYLLQAKLGAGGMGAVYLAKKKGEDRVVALKILPEKFSDEIEFVRRFQREAKIVTELSHPNIVKGYEFGQVDHRWYFAMEYVKGTVVSDLIRSQMCLDEKFSLKVAVQVTAALEAIHQNGLVHRDVKPENIMIGEDGGAKLMDLGLVKCTLKESTRLTQTGAILGTLSYMSPEQIQGSAIDIRSDIFCLGATLYHMVTGVRPFKGTALVELVGRQVTESVPHPKTIRPILADATCRIIEKSMAYKPEHRYASPAEVLRDLTNALDGAPIKTPPMESGSSMIRPLTSPESEFKTAMLKVTPPPPRRTAPGLVVGIGLALAFGAGVFFFMRPSDESARKFLLIDEIVRPLEREKQYDRALLILQEARRSADGGLRDLLDRRIREIESLQAKSK